MAGEKNGSVSRQKGLKITAVGDGMVGKTCMLITYTTQDFPTEYIPTVFDNYAGNITVEGLGYSVTLWDTAGQEDYERLRPLSYPGTDCFLLCYSVGSRSSYENVHSKWYPELRHYSATVPIVLVATKTDLRAEDIETISTAEGKKLRRKIKAAKFVECSAKSGEGLNDVFVEAVRSVNNKKKPCIIL